MSDGKRSFQEILDEFTHGQITVDCPYPIQILDELVITRKLNRHGQVQVKGILWEEKGGECIRRMGSRDPIVVSGDNGCGKTILFSGVITEANVTYRDRIYYVEIKGSSWSSLLDYQEKSRSFQDKNMKYDTLIRRVLKDYPKGAFVNAAKPSDRSIGQFILQYRETDWEFCKRLASHFQTQLVADVSGRAPRFWFGLPKNNGALKSVGEVVAKRAADQYQRAIAAGFCVQEDQFVKYHIKSKERLEPGDMVRYEGRPMIVEESRIFLEQGALRYAYVLGLEASLSVPKQMNAKIQGIALLGEVLERENQRVKLKLKIDAAQDASAACWFPYASEANNLFYCMPEIGTSISLYFSGSDETCGIAMNAVRKNGGSCAKTSNPSMKYMGIPEGKEMKLGIGDISFEAHEKLFMKMDAGNGVSVQSHEEINIFTKQKLLLEAQEMIKVFAKTGNIIVGAKEESSLYLIGGADGDAHVKAGNKLIYEGRKKERFTERLNEAIAYEEKKLDVGKLLGNILIGLAVVALVAATIATGGAALAAAGVVAQATVTSVVTGAAISGAIAVGTMAVSDVMRGEVSDWQDYALAGLKGAIEGAVSGAILGIKALQGAKLLAKMFISGGVSFLTDAISQGIDYLYSGKAYDWKQGLLAFGIGFAMPAISAGIRKGYEKFMQKFGKKIPWWWGGDACKWGGDPVDLVSGNVVYDTVDFELPGPLPLQWRRIWCSASQIMGHLGHGTRYNYEMGLEVSEEEHFVTVFLNDGRVCMFPDILAGEEIFSDENKLLLRRKEDHYQLFDPQTRYTYLLYPSENGYFTYKLTKMHNPQGHQIQFFYDSSGYLCRMTDSAGRKLDVATNPQGRITQVALKEEGGHSGSHVLVRYAYNTEQDLVTITDAVGADTCLKYRNHLMIRKTDRNRNSFYWEYDRYEDGARAVKTWGDEGILSLWIDYYDEERYNVVRTDKDSLPSEYHYNENMLCTKIVYPDLTETRETYNDRYQLVNEVDEEGRITMYRYNDWSQVTDVTLADAGKVCFSYDTDGRLVEVTDPEGGSRKWIYREDETLEKTVDEAGVETVYHYNPDKLVETVTYANQAEVRLEYDPHYNLSKVTLPDGSSSSWEYDQRGNCLTEKNPMGGVDVYRYDALNRLVKASLADGNEVRFAYDGYDDVIHAKDRQSEVDFTYTALGSLLSRTQGGRKIAYAYNRQEELVSITNEIGETYRFERDAKGNIVKEEGYDGLVRTYERDASGLVTKINRPGNRFTKYRYDKLGRVIRTDYHDKSYEIFTYNKNGALTEAENEHTKIKLERDASGRITKEWQDGHWISVQYDTMGNRTQTKSSFGANILTRRNQMGQVTHLTAYLDKEKPLTAEMEYNAFGQETKRLVSGGVCSSWEYDRIGRPVSHEVNMVQERPGRRQNFSGHVRGYSETLRRRSYEWDVNDRLKRVANGLTKGAAMFSYDQFSNLVSAKESGFETIFRATDAVGNLYETQDQSDRVYGPGSRLERSGVNLKEKRNGFQGGYGKLVTRGREYSYDEEGNLSEKKEANGSTWRYLYYGNGMLKEVIRPDQSSVCFQYDTFGRRVEKSIVGKRKEKAAEKKRETVTRFLWDGNTLFHEWEEEKTADTGKSKPKVDYKADFLLKLEKREAEKARKQEEQGKGLPDNLITWVFQDDFIPRGKITKDGSYSIITDYLGTPVETYDGEGRKVWERELDIYGRVKPGTKDTCGKDENGTGEQNFIPFRFQGQYEDEETGLYYNRFRYYSPEDGCYTQQDPIGLAGGNPTIYGYVGDTNIEFDLFGLDSGRMPTWMNTRQGYQRHHIIPYSVWNKVTMFQKSGMDVNGATNMTYLPVAEGIDLANPNSSLHLNNNIVHVQYNDYVGIKANDLNILAEENNWSQRKIQKEIRKLQRNLKKQLKRGTIKCH